VTLPTNFDNDDYDDCNIVMALPDNLTARKLASLEDFNITKDHNHVQAVQLNQRHEMY
jgi:hypothetical protein